ncbi:ribosomal protein S5 domain 2-type protein [Mycotypha africana]|uniref:ribosomal protein S5 domain 2-type protein n=1 Tax=Mycotypha africana TaxID=64632 RepID=UPI0023002B0C|nr:ribosomal protein S5 domain 2-type protein [Mycotypha africana]KAI8970216.1 ribosomal protein S5 domain 2-type protein [Mycotypha africana]
MTATKMVERVLVSAPGKVILFGEHSVVYQKMAVAASLGLRTYLCIERRQDNLIRLLLPDVKADRTWKLDELPIDVDFTNCDTRHPSEMPEKLQSRLVKLADADAQNPTTQAVMAFLYLLVIIQIKAAGTPLDHGFTIIVRSFLPVGAGLGSSASYSVVISTALLILYNLIPVDFNSSSDRELHLELINKYAFKAEEVIHGNPSGVDNAVATFGGAKSFVRGQGFSTLEGFKSLNLLLTNTNVPRSTSALVAAVSEKRKKYPEIIEPILESMHNIGIRCRDAFKKLHDGAITTEDLMVEIGDLVVLNHSLLDGLGVSHPSLEKIRSITAQHGLKTKLTGAGGGGCAVTFIGDDIVQSVVDEVMSFLKDEGFDCYQTSIGGIGANAVPLTNNESSQWLLETDRSTLEQYM